MADKKDYAKWCVMLIEGDDYIVDDIYEALHDDGFVDEDQEWNYDHEDDDE